MAEKLYISTELHAYRVFSTANYSEATRLEQKVASISYLRMIKIRIFVDLSEDHCTREQHATFIGVPEMACCVKVLEHGIHLTSSWIKGPLSRVTAVINQILGCTTRPITRRPENYGCFRHPHSQRSEWIFFDDSKVSSEKIHSVLRVWSPNASPNSHRECVSTSSS
jgi:hypothetical protein